MLRAGFESSRETDAHSRAHDLRGPPRPPARTPYLPKQARQRCRDCEVEGRVLPSASTTSSARSLCADGRLGGSFQLSRARMVMHPRLELVISSVRRCSSRTCSPQGLEHLVVDRHRAANTTGEPQKRALAERIRSRHVFANRFRVAPPGRLPRSSHPIRGEGLDTRTAWLTAIARRGEVTNAVAVAASGELRIGSGTPPVR
jgi:hypothetical protein